MVIVSGDNYLPVLNTIHIPANSVALQQFHIYEQDSVLRINRYFTAGVCQPD